MEVKDALDIMNSDFKLWEKAESEDLGGGKVVKTLTLPWGIGEVKVTLEGMTDADKRRQAVAGYGNYIRDLINEATADEAIEARARQAAALAKPADSGGSPIIGGEQRVRDAAVQEETHEVAGETHEHHAKEPVSIGETLAARRLEIEDELDFYRGRLEAAEREVARLSRDLRSVERAIAAIEEDENDTDTKKPRG